MNSKTIQGALKLLIALSMLPAPFVPEVAFAKAAAPASKCEPMKQCKKSYDAWMTQQGFEQADSTRASTGPKDGGERIKDSGNRTSAMACPAKEKCAEEKKKCDEAVKKKTCSEKDCEEIEKMAKQAEGGCADGMAAAAGGAKTQAAASSGDSPKGGESSGSSGKSGGGGDGAMMGALMGAALGAGMAMMMQKKKEEEAAAAQQQVAYNGALQANGSIDCSKPDAMAYRDCAPQIEARCRTILDDPTCQQFSAGYCGGGAPATIMVQPQTPPNVTFGVNPATLYAAGGEGVGSQYCQGVMSWNFCKTAGRETCPSCQQIQRNQSPACAQNPALCIAQNSISEVEKAKAYCPTDPAFANPTFSAGGALGAPAIAGAPAVVLPQSVGGGVANTGVNGAVAAKSGGGISTQSASVAGGGQGQSQAGEAAREGISNGSSQANYANGNGGGGRGGVIGSSGGSRASVGGGREFASAGGMKPSTASASGPASDVEGQYGPSLFSTSSQVIRRRCAAGRLNNCP